MLQRTKPGIVAALVLVAAAPGCSTFDEIVFGTDVEPDPRGVTAAPLADDTPFPPVATVPPRPHLSYSVQQERAIVDALISDRENARYTGEVVRYRAGLAATPPREPPPTALTIAGEAIVGPLADVPPDAADAPVNEEGALPSPAELRALEGDRGRFDDAGLEDFVRDLVDETALNPDLDTETAIIDRQDDGGPPVPGRKGRESAFQRLFYWLVSDGEEGAGGGVPAGDDAGTVVPPPAEVEVDPVAPSAAADAVQARVAAAETTADEVVPGAEPPRASEERTDEPDPEPADDARRPRLKPDEGADPPAPAPAKPASDGRSEPSGDAPPDRGPS